MEQFIIDNWTEKDYDSMILFLKDHADLKYRDFHSRLVPGKDKNYFIGIRLPFLRKLGKYIAKGNPRSFLLFPKDNYYEEAMLYGIVVGNIKADSYDDFCRLFDDFVPRINNWAVCDSCSGKSRDFKKYKTDYFSYIEKYLNSENPWAIRYGIITMFQYKDDEKYYDTILDRLKNIKNEHYYVKTAKAWLTAELFSFNSEKVFNFLKENYYDRETFLMTCSKIRESYRVTDEWKKKVTQYKKLLDKM